MSQKISITQKQIETIQGSIISIDGENINRDFQFVQDLFDKMKKTERKIRNSKELKKQILLKIEKYSKTYFDIYKLKKALEILEQTAEDPNIKFMKQGIDCLEVELEILAPLFNQGALILQEMYPAHKFDLAAKREGIDGGIKNSEYRLTKKANPVFITAHGGQQTIINPQAE